MAGSLWDGSPDSWGQRVIIARLTGKYGTAADEVNLDPLTILLESAIVSADWTSRPRADEYAAGMESATLDELHEATDALQAGVLRADLATALVDGTSVGGARPKVLIGDGDA